MTTPKLKPCPDPGCTHTPRIKNRLGLLYYVGCPCGWCGPLCSTPDAAAEAWNRRDTDGAWPPKIEINSEMPDNIIILVSNDGKSGVLLNTDTREITKWTHPPEPTP